MPQMYLPQPAQLHNPNLLTANVMPIMYVVLYYGMYVSYDAVITVMAAQPVITIIIHQQFE